MLQHLVSLKPDGPAWRRWKWKETGSSDHRLLLELLNELLIELRERILAKDLVDQP